MASAALAQVKGVSTTFNGSSSGSGTFSRTIIDVTDPPPGPGGRGAFQTQSTHLVTVTVPPGKTNKQIAVAVRDSLNLQVGSFGYTAVFPDVDRARRPYPAARSRSRRATAFPATPPTCSWCPRFPAPA
jgi:hypothetical protein